MEVTTRTVHGRFLLKPGLPTHERIVGVLARAKRQHPEVRVCAVAYLGNHSHHLLWTPDARSLSGFMRDVNGNVAREVGRLVGWREKFWGRRYRSIPVSDEEGAQRERLAYVLGQSVREQLVERVLDWPGVHSAKGLLTGEPLRGYWFDRTQEYNARRRGKNPGPYDFATEEVLELEPIPCWQHLATEDYRARVAELIEEVERQAAVERKDSERPVVGLEKIRRQHPHEHPVKSKKEPAPLVHAATQTIRKELREAYGWFLAVYREAAERLKAGDPRPGFPEGSFPPALPFVPSATTPTARPP